MSTRYKRHEDETREEINGRRLSRTSPRAVIFGLSSEDATVGGIRLITVIQRYSNCQPCLPFLLREEEPSKDEGPRQRNGD